MKMTIVLLVVLGIVAGICAVVLVGAIPGMINGGKITHVTVLVATRPIKAHTDLSKDDLETLKIDLSQEAGYFKNENVYLKDLINAVGKTVSSDIVAGQPITKDMIITDPDRAAIMKALTDGMRAYPVRLSSDQIEGGLLAAGCFVDAIVTSTSSTRSKNVKGEAVSLTFLEKIKVIAVKGELEGDDSLDAKAKGGSSKMSSGGWTVTLLVDTGQVELLQLATTKGKISLTLRNPLDDEPVSRAGTVWDSSKIGVHGVFFNSAEENRDSSRGRGRGTPKHEVEVIRRDTVSYEEVEALQTQ